MPTRKVCAPIAMPGGFARAPVHRSIRMLNLNRIFASKLSAFNQIRALVEDFADAAGIDPADRHKLTLIVEELFTNTVRHGHRRDCDEPVDITLSSEPSGVTLTYVDTAPKYDSLAAAMRTDIESTVRQRRIGGLGVALTFALAEAAQYNYIDGKNRIVIRLRNRK
jgi:anti-sigma regulatory factor (Ser/Thr protein kinase)